MTYVQLRSSVIHGTQIGRAVAKRRDQIRSYCLAAAKARMICREECSMPSAHADGCPKPNMRGKHERAIDLSSAFDGATTVLEGMWVAFAVIDCKAEA